MNECKKKLERNKDYDMRINNFLFSQISKERKIDLFLSFSPFSFLNYRVFTRIHFFFILNANNAIKYI